MSPWIKRGVTKRISSLAMLTSLVFVSSFNVAYGVNMMHGGEYLDSVKPLENCPPSFDWHASNQGYRVYLKDANGNRASKVLDITFGGINGDKLGTYITYTGTESYKKQTPLDEYKLITFMDYRRLTSEESLLPLALGYEVNKNTGETYVVGYKGSDGSTAIMSWLFGEDVNNYYIVGNGYDFDSITDAIKQVSSEYLESRENSRTIYISNNTTGNQYNESVYAFDFDKKTCTSQFVTHKEPAFAIVGLTTNGAKPVIQNTSQIRQFQDFDTGNYYFAPLMIASGLVKDIDIYETVESDSYKANSSFIDKANIKVESYAFHSEDPDGIGRNLLFSNCTIQSNGNQAVGIGTRQGQKITFKDCTINNTALSNGNGVFIHNNTLESDIGESYVEFINTRFICERDIINKSDQAKNNLDPNRDGVVDVLDAGSRYPDGIVTLMQFTDGSKASVNKLDVRFFNCEQIGNNSLLRLVDMKDDSVNYIDFVGVNINDYIKNSHFNWSGQTINKLSNSDITKTVFKYKKDEAITQSLNPLNGTEDTPRIQDMMNLRIDNNGTLEYYFDNILNTGVRIGDNGIEDAIDMMVQNNYNLVIEPIVWFAPSTISMGVYKDVNESAPEYVYGTYNNLIEFFNDNKQYGISTDNKDYTVMNVLSNMCIGR